MAIARKAKSLTNPAEYSGDAIADGRAHFADHRATCHANNGSGKTPTGSGLWPKAPDMRLPETQGLSDGELFWIIENGIRFTGMPACGRCARRRSILRCIPRIYFSGLGTPNAHGHATLRSDNHLNNAIFD